MSVEPEGNTLFIGISYAMLREGYTADEIIEFWQLEDEDQITSIVDSLDFNEDSQYLNEDTEVSDEYYFSQIEYIEEGVLRSLKALAGKFWRGTKGLVKRGKDKIDDVANKADDGLKTNRSGPDGSKTYKPGGGGTGAAGVKEQAAADAHLKFFETRLPGCGSLGPRSLTERLCSVTVCATRPS